MLLVSDIGDSVERLGVSSFIGVGTGVRSEAFQFSCIIGAKSDIDVTNDETVVLGTLFALKYVAVDHVFGRVMCSVKDCPWLHVTPVNIPVLAKERHVC